MADLDDLIALRREIHADPELGFEEHRTAARIAAELERLGIETHRNIGGTGVVGVLRHGVSPRSIGLRADMDALPMQEQTGLAHASRNTGVFHGCGHDGHVAMLLGAARSLTETRRFDGTVNFIFQPAEEGLGGARAMIADGLFKRFPCDHVFAIHNWPDLPAGTLQTRAGPIMASADRFEIEIHGRGGHAAFPEKTPDAILAAGELIGQLNTIVSRRIAATSPAVLSVTQVMGGEAHNVIPDKVRLVGTVRTFDAAVQDRIEEEIRRVADGIGIATATRTTVHYDRYYPATINDADAAAAAIRIAGAVGPAGIAPEPAMTSEDFAYMLQERPGAYLWLGAGGGVSLHHPHYDFNDGILDVGAKVHVALAEAYLAI